MNKLPRFTFGMGDRFAHQGEALLSAVQSAAKLPAIETVRGWSSQEFVSALNHDASCPKYDRQFRQFIHVVFKVAAGMGTRDTDALKSNSGIVGRRVHDNLLKKHIEPLFC